MDEDFIADALADDGLDVDASIHAPSNKENNSSPNVSPNMETDGGQSPNQVADLTPTITINQTYESYTGHAKMTGSGDAKRLVIHFKSAEARDACCNSTHAEFPDLLFHPHDPRQLRDAEDLRAIQVTDIPFFVTKSQLEAHSSPVCGYAFSTSAQY
ncbi:hypothetical protein C1646_772287 [Rhizophagus diaphanus]|nr:hypothetical protein C1646_772287 [Rhizophagus diaphanus] [Rhizophagus sp. MUCL 43196]